MINGHGQRGLPTKKNILSSLEDIAGGLTDGSKSLGNSVPSAEIIISRTSRIWIRQV
jgi:hypothetical protein